MKKEIKTPKNSIVLQLCKHANENRYLMSWYTLSFNGKTVNFQRDELIPEDVNDKLDELHCTISNSKKLLDECSKLLMPYLDEIVEKASNFLSLPLNKQKELMNSFDEAHFENPLLIEY